MSEFLHLAGSMPPEEEVEDSQYKSVTLVIFM